MFSYLLLLLIASLQFTGALGYSYYGVPTWGIVCLALVGSVLVLLFLAFALMIAMRRRQSRRC
ncbi:hypothetical protein GDO78_020266 [Eleutherodactylus coqui]|uniref:NADH dehydrogenase subunit 6 n=1 Tax=Eleutherodactylus coqui TaxID=57060 RepID=A0A8J6JZC7_ELECQ|nr:hypothetical protein GDO78_020266 [Eleutherodactylus coqui]